MRAVELISNLVWVLLGFGICLYAVRLRLWDAAGPASGFLPFIAGLFVGLIGLALLLQEWARRPRERRPTPFWEDAAARNRVGLVVIGLCAMALLMPLLGFLLAATLVMTFLLGLAHPRSPGVLDEDRANRPLARRHPYQEDMDPCAPRLASARC